MDKEERHHLMDVLDNYGFQLEAGKNDDGVSALLVSHPERLHKQFPIVTDDELRAFVVGMLTMGYEGP